MTKYQFKSKIRKIVRLFFRFLQIITFIHKIHHIHHSYGFKIAFLDIGLFRKLRYGTKLGGRDSYYKFKFRFAHNYLIIKHI